MAGKKFQLTTLETRKQLLLVDSELNRVQLLNELRVFRNEIHLLQNHMEAISSLAATAAKLAATFSAVGAAFTHRDARTNGKSSWISTLFNGARAGVVLWETLRSHLK